MIRTINPIMDQQRYRLGLSHRNADGRSANPGTRQLQGDLAWCGGVRDSEVNLVAIDRAWVTARTQNGAESSKGARPQKSLSQPRLCGPEWCRCWLRHCLDNTRSTTPSSAFRCRNVNYLLFVRRPRWIQIQSVVHDERSPRCLIHGR